MGLHYDKGDWRDEKNIIHWLGSELESDIIPYHSSWDWLMSVVKKIDALGISIDDEVGSARQYSVVGSSIGMVTIESVWLACVEFVKWYNQNETA